MYNETGKVIYMAKRYAFVHEDICVACGACENVCPKSAIKVWKGTAARVDLTNCVGCGICAKTCPAGAIDINNRDEEKYDSGCLNISSESGSCKLCGDFVKTSSFLNGGNMI